MRTPLQLVRYTFKDARANVPTNGYSDSELFLGQTATGKTMALFCFEERDDIRSPECWREFEISKTVTVSYRYKRRLLEEWKAIDAKIEGFVRGLAVDKP